MPKQPSPHDPHLAREAAKYDNPIPSREFILALLEASDAPMTMEDVSAALALHEPDPLEALRRRLQAMERDGQIMRNRRGTYAIVEKLDLIKGRVTAHPEGYGFLIPDEGGDDLYVPPRQMRACLHGDRAMARVTGIDRRGRREAAIVEVLERNTTSVVGRYFIEQGVAYVVPDNKRIFQNILIGPESQGRATPGQIVVAELTQQPDFHRQPLGRIAEVLGDHMAPGMEIDVAIRANDVPHVWPAAVEDEISHLTPEVPEAAKAGREDLRALPLVTIDGVDARDFDDAVYAERVRKGWRLIVAIADVSHYVMPGTALDAEAQNRGNSVYFPERVVPMLPEILSNGLCSINPQVDRLCMACEMLVDDSGEVTEHRFMQAVMRSHARLTYTEVAAMLIDRDAGLRNQHAALVPHLETLHALYGALHRARQTRGAIDFETTETRIVFGADRKIESVVPVVRNDAHRLIEECMIAANVAAAQFLAKNKIPIVYRVHEGPTAEKLTDLRTFLGELGLKLGGGKVPQAEHYAQLLEKVRGRPDFNLIQTVMLRSLSQAVYSPDNAGHFGLALGAYTHFTSPIRRYPDLLVHRALRHVLAGRKAATFAYSKDGMAELGANCSLTERRADEATRDAIEWLKCEYMMDKIGEVYDGIITGVAGFGIFVQLQEIYVEGMVHVTALPNDYYHHEAGHHRMRGERTGRTFGLSMPVRVKVMRVDLDQRRIDFELDEVAEPKPAKPTKPSGTRRRRKK